MESPFRRDRWAEYLASDTDLPYSTWLHEQRNLARARVTASPQPRTSRWSVTILVVIILACIVATGVAIAIGALRGAPQ